MDSGKSLESIQVLLVEDNPGDVDLARMSLENSKLKVILLKVLQNLPKIQF